MTLIYALQMEYSSESMRGIKKRVIQRAAVVFGCCNVATGSFSWLADYDIPGSIGTFVCIMQPPLKRRPRQRDGRGGQAVTATVDAPKHRREMVLYQPGGGGASDQANSGSATEDARAVLSGKLSRCMPLFAPS